MKVNLIKSTTCVKTKTPEFYGLPCEGVVHPSFELIRAVGGDAAILFSYLLNWQLTSQRKGKGEQCWRSQADIQTDLGYSPRTQRHLRAKLKKAGLIEEAYTKAKNQTHRSYSMIKAAIEELHYRQKRHYTTGRNVTSS